MGQEDKPDNLLWRLPAELREQIYLDAFGMETAISNYDGDPLDLCVIGNIVILRPSRPRRHKRRGNHAIGLLQTCKAIHKEAHPALYAPLRYTLRLGGPSRRSHDYDVGSEINLGLIKNCLILRHARHLDMCVELHSTDQLEYLLEHQLARVTAALRTGIRPEIKLCLVAISGPVPESSDGEVLAALQVVVGGEFEALRRAGLSRRVNHTRMYHKVEDTAAVRGAFPTEFDRAQKVGL